MIHLSSIYGRHLPILDSLSGEYKKFMFLAAHYHELSSMFSFDLNEALHEWSRMKREISEAPFFGLSYKQFWEHVSRHYDTIHGYKMFLF